MIRTTSLLRKLINDITIIKHQSKQKKYIYILFLEEGYSFFKPPYVGLMGLWSMYFFKSIYQSAFLRVVLFDTRKQKHKES